MNQQEQDRVAAVTQAICPRHAIWTTMCVNVSYTAVADALSMLATSSGGNKGDIYEIELNVPPAMLCDALDVTAAFSGVRGMKLVVHVDWQRAGTKTWSVRSEHVEILTNGV